MVGLLSSIQSASPRSPKRAFRCHRHPTHLWPFFCRGLEGSQDGPFACRDSLLTEHAPIPRNRASPGHEDRHLMISFLPALDSPKTGIPKPEPVRRTTIRLRFSYCCVLREHRVNVAFRLPPGTIDWSPYCSAICFGAPEPGGSGAAVDVLEWCRYACCCHTLCREHAARVDGLRRSRRLPGQP